ncbi:MAG: glutamyl-tRNA reductase [Thaumarchaeota archaeon]|nr:glutamyl-tRNA reductase [Nitrososphaerota archaeon]
MKSNLGVSSATIAKSVPRDGDVSITDYGNSKRTRDETSAHKGKKATESSILLVGASFKTSSLAFRERLAKKVSRDAEKLRRMPGMKEYAELVTCNRVEMVMATYAPQTAERFFRTWSSETTQDAAFPLYLRKDTEAIAHLFRVASGLDSMVIGEDQILSQVREAGVRARTQGSSRGSLSALFDASVNVGKRVGAALKKPIESSSPSDRSVSASAVRFALDRLSRDPENVLLIGTGKTTRLAADQFKQANVFVATRRALPSFSRAKVVSHKDLRKVAERCDLIISATKHDGYLLKKGDLSDSKRRVVLDLAFPRNIDPDLKSASTEVYNLDDLARVFAPRASSLSPEARRAEQLVSDEAERFSRWLLASKRSSTLADLYLWAEGLRHEETVAVLRRLPGLSEREKEVVQAMSKRLVSKLMAPPTRFAKASTPDLPQGQRLDIVQRVFDQEGT